MNGPRTQHLAYDKTLLWRDSCPSRGIVSTLKTERERFLRKQRHLRARCHSSEQSRLAINPYPANVENMVSS